MKAQWLAVPIAVGLLALAGLALSSQSREQFEDANPRTAQEQQASGKSSEQTGEGTGEGNERTDGDSGRRGGPRADSFDGWSDGSWANVDPTVTLTNDDGTVEIRVDGTGEISATKLAEDDANTTPSPDRDGKLYSGLRFDSEGHLLFVEVGDEQALDILVTPTEDGNGLTFELIAGIEGGEPTIADSSAVELRQGGQVAVDNAEITATVTAGESFVVLPVASMDTPPSESGSETFILEAGQIAVWLSADGELMGRRVEVDATIVAGGGHVIVLGDGPPRAVPLSEVEPGDVVIAATDGGCDRTDTAGRLVEFRADGWDGGLTSTQVDGDGTRTELQPSDDGGVLLPDGTRAAPVSASRRPFAIAGPIPWRLVATTIALTAILSAALALALSWMAKRTTGERSDEQPNLGRATTLDSLLADLASDPEPTRAIRRAFHVTEAGFGILHARYPTETPFEWSDRVGESAPGLAEPLSALCDLFAKARFAPNRATVDDQRRMIELMTKLASESKAIPLGGSQALAATVPARP